MSELKYGKATGVDFTVAKTQPKLESPRVPGRTGKHMVCLRSAQRFTEKVIG